MDNMVKAALILAGAAVFCTVLNLYYSPYHSCMREGHSTRLCLAAF